MIQAIEKACLELKASLLTQQDQFALLGAHRNWAPPQSWVTEAGRKLVFTVKGVQAYKVMGHLVGRRFAIGRCNSLDDLAVFHEEFAHFRNQLGSALLVQEIGIMLAAQAAPLGLAAPLIFNPANPDETRN